MSSNNQTSHVASMTELVVTFAVLIVLTVVTVGASRVDLGNLDVWVALGIAGTKAALVAIFFMQLRHDRGINTVLLIGSILLLVLFLGLSLTDLSVLDPSRPIG